MFLYGSIKGREDEIFIIFAVGNMASRNSDRQTRSGKAFADKDVPESSRKGKGGPRKKDHDVSTRSQTSLHGNLKIGKSFNVFKMSLVKNSSLLVVNSKFLLQFFFFSFLPLPFRIT